MGLLNAFKQLGEGSSNDPFLPHVQLPGDVAKVKVLLVGLEVNSLSPPFDVQGVSLSVSDMVPGNRSPEQMKRAYLCKETSSPQAKWSFSPVFTENGAVSKLLNGEFDAGFDRLKYRVLQDLVKEQLLSPGSLQVIDSGMKKELSRFSAFFHPKEKWVLVFGVSHAGAFSYPGDLGCFREYFLSKLADGGGKGDANQRCALCGKSSKDWWNLDSVFAFATFDKPHVLPGMKKKERNKVFPICSDCQQRVSQGRRRVEENFCMRGWIPGLKVWLIPEIIGEGPEKRFLLGKFQDYVESRKDRIEELVFQELLSKDLPLVFHFVFWEQSQAKEMVHSMVEDVSPSWFRVLFSAWKDACRVHSQGEGLGTSLDQALRFVLRAFSDVRKETLGMHIVSQVLKASTINVEVVKQGFVQRYPFLFSRGEFVGRKLRGQLVLTEFLDRVNRAILARNGKEESA